MTIQQQTPWNLTTLTSNTIDDVKVLTNTQGCIIVKQGDDMIWLNPDQVDQLRATMKDFQ